MSNDRVIIEEDDYDIDEPDCEYDVCHHGLGFDVYCSACEDEDDKAEGNL